MSCFCGCRDRLNARHHCVYAQHLRQMAPHLLDDERNLVPVARVCHGSHHARSQPYTLAMLPDSVYEFAVEVMGPEKAYNYLERRYAGEDARLDALLGAVAA